MQSLVSIFVVIKKFFFIPAKTKPILSEQLISEQNMNSGLTHWVCIFALHKIKIINITSKELIWFSSEFLKTFFSKQ